MTTITKEQAKAIADTASGNDAKYREFLDSISKTIEHDAKRGLYRTRINEVPEPIHRRLTEFLRGRGYKVGGTIYDDDTVNLLISWDS